MGLPCIERGLSKGNTQAAAAEKEQTLSTAETAWQEQVFVLCFCAEGIQERVTCSCKMGYQYAQVGGVTLQRVRARSAQELQPLLRQISNTERAILGALEETYIMSAIKEKLSTRARDT